MMTEGGGPQLRLSALEVSELRLALEAANQARTLAEQKLAETAHDLRSGLAAIIGYAEILDDSSREARTPQEIPRRIARLALALSDMVSELTSSLQPHAHHRSRRSFSVRALLETCAQEIEPRCREKGLTLRVSAPTERFISEPATIRRIVHNLLTNAVRYTESGEISVAGAIDESGALRLEVRDTGIGIAAEHLARIFEPHFRLDAARRLEPLGTGLGLSVVKRCCDSLHGDIEVVSSPGVGSVFRVWLPPPRRKVRERIEQRALFAT